MQTMKKEREILAIPHRIHAMVTCTLFCQWQTRLQAVGRTIGVSVGSGRMVMQAAADLLVGSSNPGAANVAAAAGQDLIQRPKILQPSALPFGQGWL